MYFLALLQGLGNHFLGALEDKVHFLKRPGLEAVAKDQRWEGMRWGWKAAKTRPGTPTEK